MLKNQEKGKGPGRPHHRVSPFLGKGGQIGSSRHNVAPFLDLSTPLDCLNYPDPSALKVESGVVDERKFWGNRM